jgi:hypothetical protein
VAAIRDSTSPADRVAPRLGLAVREEFRRIGSPPYGVIWCIVINAVLVTTLWFVPIPAVQDLVFTLHKTFWFPIVLASWLISDVPSTNQLAPDRWRVLAAIDDPASIDRLLRAKHVAIWCITTPITVLAAIVVGATSGAWITMALTVLYVATVPLASIGIACIVGVRWPYHELPLRTRWTERRRWRPVLLRWGVLIVLPYGLVPLLGCVAMAPCLVVWFIARQAGWHGSDLDLAFAAGVVVALPFALAVWHRATTHAARLAVRRADALRTYLSDPLLG